MPIINPLKVQIKDFQEITVAIDTLDDIFSDFDPRPLHLRALSEDFLKEIQKFYRESTSGPLNIVFLGPISLKGQLEKNFLEKGLISHLRQEFKRRSQYNLKGITRQRRRGLAYIALGMILLSSMTILGYTKIVNSLTLEILGIVFMPIGWFGVWEGFSHQVEVPERLKEDYQMFEKLSKAQYVFKYLGSPVVLPPGNKTT